jgi:L-aspartate oxidase
MTDFVGVERDGSGLRHALRGIASLESEAPEGAQGFRNMTAAATLIAAGALLREESRGGHARSDFPSTLPEARASEWTLDAALAVRAGA